MRRFAGPRTSWPARLGAAGTNRRVAAIGALVVVATLSAPIPAALAQTAVELDEIRVQGNTVLDAREIEQTVYPFLGPGKTAQDIEHARAALAHLYQTRGFATVSVAIPPQRVTQGIVYLVVVEQPVERLRVVGAHHVEPDVLRAQAPSVHKGRIPNLLDLRHDVARLNRLPDRTVTPSFRPGRAPNTVDVDLQVQDTSPLHATLELNNRRSVDTTDLRLNGSLTYDNLFQRGDTASLFFQLAPENTADTRVVGGSYLYHIPASLLALLFSYTDSDSLVNTVGDLNVVGRGKIASVRLQVPLGIEDGFIHTFTAGMDYKRLDENVAIGVTAPTRYPVTYYPVTLAYEADWTGAKSQTSVNASAVFGLRGLGSDTAAFDQKRFAAKPDFAYLRATLARTQTLPRDFQLYASLEAQATPDVLVSTEQLSIGGLDSVRGYLESEALGDQGVALQMEARSPSISAHLGRYVDSWRFHLFSDVGNVSIHNALLQQATSYTLSSVGVGTRISLFGYLNATLEDAVLLARGPNSRSGDNRVLFRINGSF